MKTKLILIFSLSFLLVQAQDVSLALQKPEIVDPSTKAMQWENMQNNVETSFANSNKRYTQDIVPTVAKQKSQTLTAWKGERVHTQMLIWSKVDISRAKVKVSNLKSDNGKSISSKHITTGFLGYVMTDEYANGCGHRKPENFDSSMVADPINSSIKSINIEKNTVQPIWVSISVPENTLAGTYTGTVTIKADKTYKLALTIKVKDNTLPPPSAWSHNLDLWQHPAAVARVHNVELWSKKHFSLMEGYLTMLAKAGQKNISVSIIDEPWGHQTYDDFPEMIKWTKKLDGSWEYDYSLFDKYVAFAMDCGITERIVCYSMVPWKVSFRYFDEKLDEFTYLNTNIGSDEYNEHWRNMLTDFTKHLKSKNLFSKTVIGLDERPMPAVKSVIKLLKEIDADWKIAFAGHYHGEIEQDIFDYCVASYQSFPEDVLNRRKQEGKLSTWYTCCTEKYPNGFTFSPPAEHVWIGWYTAAKNLDGYLRWAYNSWTKNPLKDSRFTAWSAGDTYQVYPGPQTSIRFDKLIEGIQDFEKIKILQKTAGTNQAKLKMIDEILALFELKNLSEETAEETVLKAKAVIDNF